MHREVVCPFPQFKKRPSTRLVEPSVIAPGESIHYSKADVSNFDVLAKHSDVVATPPSTINPGATPVNRGFSDLSKVKASIVENLTTNITTAVRFEGSASEPMIEGAASIDWWVNILIGVSDPLNPQVSAIGKHDNFPAYEFYVNANHPILPVTEIFQSVPPLPVGVTELMTNFDYDIGPILLPIKK